MSSNTLSPTSPTSAQLSKAQRILACVLCKQRKVKCDRRFPCSTCVKARIQCVPASLIQPQRRKRRFPERELLSRLRRYEDLLHQHHIPFEPLHGHPTEEKDSPHSGSGSDLDDEHMEDVSSDVSAKSPSEKSRRAFQARSIWQDMRLAAQDPNVDDDIFTQDAREAAIKKAWDSTTEKADHLLFGLRKSTIDLSASHPSPVHIFRLWQIYLDNVNPLLKVTHTPTLQGRIVEAASNIASLNPNLEALMFGIYSMAILSLEDGDCQSMFSASKDDLLMRYQYSCQQALLNGGFLGTSDRDCLCALLFYLISVRPSTIPPNLSSMLGVAIRVAQRMGIHTEVLLAKCTPLEAEMRRRLWWALVLFDARICELSNTTVMTLDPTWDCKVPLNVNDSDLRPEMKIAPSIQGRCTDTIFAFVRGELADFYRHAAFHLDFTNPGLRSMAKRPSLSSDITDLNRTESRIEEQYLKFCDVDNPIHYMTIWTTRGRIAKCHLLDHHSRYSGPEIQQTDTQRDLANSYAIRILECDTMIMTAPLVSRFRWLNLMYFPLPSYIHLSQDLRQRPSSRHSQRAWQVMSDNFDAWHTPLFNENLFFQSFAKVVQQAWTACHTGTGQSKDDVTTPRIITTIKTLQQQAKEHATNTIPEQFDMAAGFQADNFDVPATMSMDFTAPTSTYSMAMSDNYPSMGPDMFSGMPVQAPFHPHMHQLAWTAFGGMPNWRGV